MKHLTVLAIESSCDETAASVYSTQNGILSNIIYSQIELHKNFGGVVPEIASRSHLEKIKPIVAQALKEASVTLNHIDVIAITNRPGLPGSLLVGLNFAKGLAYASNKKLIGVNHLEGHVFSACIENTVPFPFLCLTASGGHTSLYKVTAYGEFTELATTKDDAAGEAFDKIAKLMQLGYPGGPLIEKLAASVDFVDAFNYPRLKDSSGDFSFSGLKTAILYDLVKKGAYDLATKTFFADQDQELKALVSSSMLVCVADIFEQKITRVLNEHHDIKALTFVGGVACNKYIRQRLQTLAHKRYKDFFTPAAQFCTDNAAMIAFVGHYKAQQNLWSDWTLDIY